MRRGEAYLAVVDTDIGYPFSLSLDRNREGMQSWQLGVNYRLTPQFTLTFAPIVTRGYESSKRDVRIEGAGILGYELSGQRRAVTRDEFLSCCR